MLGDAHLAIPATLVHAVVRPTPVTPVAGAEPWLLGVTAVRGRVLPVADLRRLAGLAPDPAGDAAADAWLVVVDDGRRGVALAGLRVRRVVACSEAVADAAAGGAPAPRLPGGGLPTRGLVRLEGDTTRGADALPPTAPLLDAAALLALVHDPTGD